VVCALSGLRSAELSVLFSLRPIDIEFMRRLHQKVNLIPVIAKSDTLTDDEILSFKQRVLNDIAHHRIEIFHAPVYDNEDEETIAENEEIIVSAAESGAEWRGVKHGHAAQRRAALHISALSPLTCLLQRKIPFAVVGSDQEIDTADGRRVRGRAYPWGVIEVDNEAHCDFVKLRQMLIRSHMEELKEHTHDALYEKYRSEKLVAMGVTQDQSVFKEVNPAAKMAEDRALHEAKLAKMENEMKLVFQQKVAEKEAKLKQRCVALLSAAWA
jgi:septin 7